MTSTGVPAYNYSYSYTQLGELSNVDSPATAYVYDSARQPGEAEQWRRSGLRSRQLCWSTTSTP